LDAEAPPTAWKYKGTNTRPPNSAKPDRNVAATLRLSNGLRNRFSGTMGSAARRSMSSQMAKTTAMDAQSVRMAGDAHVYRLPPQAPANTRAVTQAPSRRAPGKSIAGFWPLAAAGDASRIFVAARTRATAPSGRFR